MTDRVQALKGAVTVLLDSVTNEQVLIDMLAALVPAAKPAAPAATAAFAPPANLTRPATRKPAAKRKPPGPSDTQKPLDHDLMARLRAAITEDAQRNVAARCQMQQGQLRVILRTGKATNRLEQRLRKGLAQAEPVDDCGELCRMLEIRAMTDGVTLDALVGSEIAGEVRDQKLSAQSAERLREILAD